MSTEPKPATPAPNPGIDNRSLYLLVAFVRLNDLLMSARLVATQPAPPALLAEWEIAAAIVERLTVTLTAAEKKQAAEVSQAVAATAAAASGGAVN